jgi:hypothetical protein
MICDSGYQGVGFGQPCSAVVKLYVRMEHVFDGTFCVRVV